ncbi:hypothetical protein [Bradyrhizobium diazoefficiens]|uniref:Uncharacterized protein n=1 Tax=Bradyrhizobium diazoefficiens TaxID=1355477 RepID=A0A809YJU3_9BRAD|nr:hypothetical protein [Bradyrhizobium diazoefficiens]BCA04177.1 hypothetical protein H12S4_50810 [Bradyrhizobium diazoefficiens]BCA21534.1 hypothetical protein BDHH15_47490 [Bradyrhizobium diazoefficiens]BCE39703.1 hypothetical protein XF3B_47340 [Bradyrhizobium diazoefficiens]BCF53099.1 hypothetical protein XF17B_47370 [Bradyrhizobium diazoefficiens]
MITISTNVAVGAGSIIMAAGFLLGYAIGWRQRCRYLDKTLDDVAEPEVTTLVVGDLETRFRRSQR